MEVDILRDGTLDLEDEMLAQLDLVVVSIHSYFGLPQAEQTERVLQAIRHPEVNILAHPTGRLINRRAPIDLDVDEVLRACVDSGVAVELNAQPSRLDLKDTQVIRARELGLKVAISTDAHRTAELDLIHYGVEQARRAWLTPDDVLNALPLEVLLEVVGRS
jgi:DNA polymerase (family 10)